MTAHDFAEQHNDLFQRWDEERALSFAEWYAAAENATLRVELAEAKSGWDSCIADLCKALRFARARRGKL